jgi:predicted metallo-beta-lactamase superfamily hydrolase
MGIHVQYLASESLGVRALAVKVVTDDISILLDPGCALGPIPNFPTPHPFEYVCLQQRTQTIIDACADARLIAISHYHHDHYKPREIEYEYIGTNPSIFQQIFHGKIVFAKHPTEYIGPNQRERAKSFQQHLAEVEGKFIPSDGRSFQFGNTSLQFSPPLPHGSAGTRLGSIIATCIKDSELCFCFCPDVQGPTEDATFDWIIAQQPNVLVIGGPPLYLPPTKFSRETKDKFDHIIEKLGMNIKVIIIDHHLFRHTSGMVAFQKLKARFKTYGCVLRNFAEQNNTRETLFEARRHQLYVEFPPNNQFQRWAHAPKKKREITPPPIPAAIPLMNS